MSNLYEQMEREGYAIVKRVLDENCIRSLKDLLTSAIPASKRAGTRRLLAIPEIKELAHSSVVMDLMKRALGDHAKAVRAILFDKQQGSNWSLAYHQDRAIAVKEKKSAEGFVGWSVKEGVTHVLPPASVLEDMMAIRLHLDDCGADNAPLRVSPKTHQLGLIDKQDISDFTATNGEVVCTCRAGDALLMHPLLLHASSASQSPNHRRVVHIEYTKAELPNGLEWFE